MAFLLSMLPWECPSIMTDYILSENQSASKQVSMPVPSSKRFVKITMDVSKIAYGKEGNQGKWATITRLYPLQRSGQFGRTVQELAWYPIIYHPAWWCLECPTTRKKHATDHFIHEWRIHWAIKCKHIPLGKAVYADLFMRWTGYCLPKSRWNLGTRGNSICPLGDSSSNYLRERGWKYQEWCQWFDNNLWYLSWGDG